MWIVRTDNYGRSGEVPGQDERRVLFLQDPIIAKKVVELLNIDGPTGGPDYYRVVPDNYKLRVFEP
jgi:hypothetical protein